MWSPSVSVPRADGVGPMLLEPSATRSPVSAGPGGPRLPLVAQQHAYRGSTGTSSSRMGSGSGTTAGSGTPSSAFPSSYSVAGALSRGNGGSGGKSSVPFPAPVSAGAIPSPSSFFGPSFGTASISSSLLAVGGGGRVSSGLASGATAAATGAGTGAGAASPMFPSPIPPARDGPPRVHEWPVPQPSPPAKSTNLASSSSTAMPTTTMAAAANE
ncbi:hypothetical protein BC828DRAFT_386252 [Blastocladiella britannica]|nr:hypothetical protein BC828DRAFT_386252 [Blastocladiella britannica]